MAAPTPFPLPSNITTLQGVIGYVNSSTNDFFGLIILGVFFMILMGAFGAYDKLRAFMAASFLVFIASVLMQGVGFVGGLVVSACAALLILSVLIVFVRNRGS